MDLLRENGAYMAARLPYVLAILALASGMVLWFLRSNRHNQRAPSRWITGARATSRTFLFASIIGLIVTYGPMSPLFRSAERLQSGIGEAVPEMTFRRVNDTSEQHLSDLRGKVVLLNLWATWCPPCRHELPALNRLQTAYRPRGLVVLTLSDEPREQLLDFVRKHAPDTLNGYVQSFGWLAIKDFRPFTLLIDRQGVLRDYVFGEQSYAAFEQKLEPYLE
jgi:thiol-disulfide isomerase/thioredoxin